jgi:hypothetical protein
VICPDCGRELEAPGACLDCPRVGLLTDEETVILTSPLSWPELSGRGRSLLRELVRVEAARERHSAPLETVDRVRAIVFGRALVKD